MKRCQESGNRIHFVSLGCARNLVDTEVMLGILLQAGYEATESVKEADFLVVNTCGFLEASRQESCDTIASLFSEKKKNAKVVVAGCMVQKHKAELQERFPHIHYFLGSGDMEKILQAVETPSPGEEVSTARSYLEWGEVPRQVSTPKHYAYLKIAEGCAKRCAFCIIPDIKGPLRSKPLERVVKEFEVLRSRGVHEVILIAQDLGDWGKEWKEKPGLETLVRELLKSPGNFWLRFLYLYPDEITDEFIALMKEDPRICAYLDMPLQHINDTVLKKMRRKTNRQQIEDRITTLRREIPHVMIRTSLMVGFPGETEEQFEELVQFIQDYPLDHIGIFKYSREEESASAAFPDHISEEVKERRFQKLVRTQKKVVEKRSRSFIGKRLSVMVEGYHPESPLLMRGRFYGQCPEIDGIVILNDVRAVTEFSKLYEVEITQTAGYDLIGKVIRKEESSESPLSITSRASISLRDS